MVPVAAGEAFTSAERFEIDKAIRNAETLCRLEFSVYVGSSGQESRAFAERLHATLVAPARSVLIVVDPSARVLEVVTGAEARALVSDSDVALAGVSMRSAFAAGDLVGGITVGVQRLAEHARRPAIMHETNQTN